MSNHEEWNEFLENLFSNATKEYQKSKEHDFSKEKQEQLDARLDEKYPDSKQEFYENYAFEIGLDAERKAEFLYRKGIRDSIFILKELGVLA